MKPEANTIFVEKSVKCRTRDKRQVRRVDRYYSYLHTSDTPTVHPFQSTEVCLQESSVGPANCCLTDVLNILYLVFRTCVCVHNWIVFNWI